MNVCIWGPAKYLGLGAPRSLNPALDLMVGLLGNRMWEENGKGKRIKEMEGKGKEIRK